VIQDFAVSLSVILSSFILGLCVLKSVILLISCLVVLVLVEVEGKWEEVRGQ
jgi:hypothetical protein